MYLLLFWELNGQVSLFQWFPGPEEMLDLSLYKKLDKHKYIQHFKKQIEKENCKDRFNNNNHNFEKFMIILENANFIKARKTELHQATV